MPDLAFGGQALIEGVMMRGPTRIATAVRAPDGNIRVDTREYTAFVDRKPVFKKPVLRGAISFFEMMAIGMKALNYSAEVASGDAEGGESKMSNWALALTMVIGLGGGIMLFVYLPLQLADFLGFSRNAIGFNLVAGGIRVTFLIA